MGFYERHVAPRVVGLACGMRPIQAQRRKVVPHAEGRVLEVGIGSGINLPFYDPARVERVIGLDPSEESWRLAGDRARGLGFDVEFVGLPGEEIPLDAGSIDTVLLTYTLCTIAEARRALEGMRRVLRPGGTLLFCEHGRAPDAAVRRWQERINPLWGRVFAGCRLDRPVPSLLEEGGFRIGRLESGYLPGTPRFAGFNYWGAAHPA